MQLTTSGKDVLVLTPDTAQYLHTFTLAEVPFPSIPPARGTLAPVWSSAVFLALGIQKQWASLCLGATTKLQPASCWCFLGLDFSSECFKEQPVHLSTGSENGHLEARGVELQPSLRAEPSLARWTAECRPHRQLSAPHTAVCGCSQHTPEEEDL